MCVCVCLEGHSSTSVEHWLSCSQDAAALTQDLLVAVDEGDVTAVERLVKVSARAINGTNMVCCVA